jgi:hypothetical protein
MATVDGNQLLFGCSKSSMFRYSEQGSDDSEGFSKGSSQSGREDRAFCRFGSRLGQQDETRKDGRFEPAFQDFIQTIYTEK